jgi:hypothetical protein
MAALGANDELVEPMALEQADRFVAGIGRYPGTHDGRGIVICGGGTRYFTNAWVCISLLRHLGCGLPIQLWYLGRNELDSYMEGLVGPLDVECVDAAAMRNVHPARILNGWEVKPYSILHSPFREVLLLDADNFAAVDPQYLFDTPEYRETGAIFWPDIGRIVRASPAWSVFGVPYRDEPEFETGQILVDKAKCWKALCLTKYYNDYSDFYYQYVYGDKETFHFAFHRVGQPYAMTRHPVLDNGLAFYQHDIAGRVVFQHRNRAKWSLTDDNPPVDDFLHEDKCFEFLETLKSVWNGCVGVPQKRIAARGGAQAQASVVATTGWLHYGFARELHPEVAVVIGPRYSVASPYIARAMQDNSAGEVLLVDRGDAADDSNAAPDGNWRHTPEGEWRFALFGDGGRIRRIAQPPPEDELARLLEAIGLKRFTMLVIDGVRSREDCLREFELYTSLMADGVVLIHHSGAGDDGVAGALAELRARGFDVAALDHGRGVSLVPVAASRAASTAS